MKGCVSIPLVALALFAAAVPTRADTIVWNNTSGGDWSTAENWTPNQVPGSSDTAIITNSGNYTVTLDIDASVSGLVLGSIDGTTQIFLVNQSLSLNGLTTINSNAQFNIAASVTFDDVQFTNCGTVNWFGGVDLYASPDSQIYNYGLWDAKDNAAFTGGTFNNFGTFRKSGGINTVYPYSTWILNDATFNNPGTVDAQIGTLQIDYGSGSGVFNSATNALLFFGDINPYTLVGDPTFSGNGYSGGSLAGSGAVLHGIENSQNCGFFGTLTLATNNTLNLLPGNFFSSCSFYSLRLTNYGVVNCNASELDGSSAVIDNHGLWNIQTNGVFYGNITGTLFNNYGTVSKSGSGTFTLDSNMTFNNPGTVDVQVGDLALGGNYTLTGGTLNFGISRSNDFGSLYLSGNVALTGTLSVNFNNGYSPATSNSFALIHYDSESGTFANKNLPHLSQPLIWQSNYGSNIFTLSIITMPPLQLSSATTTQGGTNFTFAWNALDGLTYQVQCTTNLAPANWINLGSPITGTNGTMAVSDFIDANPQKFYRLLLLP